MRYVCWECSKLLHDHTLLPNKHNESAMHLMTSISWSKQNVEIIPHIIYFVLLTHKFLRTKKYDSFGIFNEIFIPQI